MVQRSVLKGSGLRELAELDGDLGDDFVFSPTGDVDVFAVGEFDDAGFALAVAADVADVGQDTAVEADEGGVLAEVVFEVFEKSGDEIDLAVLGVDAGIVTKSFDVDDLVEI